MKGLFGGKTAQTPPIDTGSVRMRMTYWWSNNRHYSPYSHYSQITTFYKPNLPNVQAPRRRSTGNQQLANLNQLQQQIAARRNTDTEHGNESRRLNVVQLNIHVMYPLGLDMKLDGWMNCPPWSTDVISLGIFELSVHDFEL